jgi:hypothetical protein
MDISDSKKEKVAHTYRQFNGDLFLLAYIGLKGWMVNGHLLPGSQHPQKEFIPFPKRARIRQFSVTHCSIFIVDILINTPLTFPFIKMVL